MNVDPLSTTKSKVGLNVREDIQATWSSFFSDVKIKTWKTHKKRMFGYGEGREIYKQPNKQYYQFWYTTTLFRPVKSTPESA